MMAHEHVRHQLPPPPWRHLLRHAATVLLVGLYCALAAPVIGTVLLALRANGLSFDLIYSPVLAPMAILYAGPGAFVLGLVFGWMILVLAQMGLNSLPVRVAAAVLVATVAWAMAEPLPEAPATDDAAVTAASHGAAFADWLVWNATAALTALLFTRSWLARRVRPQADPRS